MRLEDLLQRQDLPEDVIAFAREELAARTGSGPRFNWPEAAQALLDCLPGPAFIKDRDSRFLLANAHVAATSSACTGDIRGHTDFDLYPPHEAQAHFDEEQQMMLEGAPPAGGERSYTGADGRRHWYTTQKLPIRDSSGETIGLVGYNCETTELHRARQALLLQRDLGVALAAAERLEEAACLILDAALQLDGVDLGGIYTVRPDGAVALAAQRNLPPHVQEPLRAFPADSDAAALVARCEPVFAPYTGSAIEGLRSLAVVPIAKGRTAIGALYLGSLTMDSLPDDVKEGIGALASQSAAALRRIISEQRQGESEERLRSLSDVVLDAIIMMDGEGRISQWNPAAERIFQYSAAEVLGQDLHALLMPGWRPGQKSTPTLDHYRRTGQSPVPGRILELDALRKDGSVVPIELSVASLQVGDEWHAVGVARDVSERKRAETDLRLHRMVLDQIRDRVTITDLDGTITYVNEAEVHTLKRSAAELIGQPVSMYGDNPERGATQDEILSRTLAEGEWRGEVANYASDGTEVVLDCRTHLIRDPEGTPVALCGIATDITERKRAEEALREREGRLSSILRAAPVGIGVVVDRMFVEVNDTLCAMTGYSRSELVGRSARMLYPSEAEYEDVGRRKYEQIRERLTGTVETRWRRRDGGVIDIILSSSPIDPDDWAHGVTFTALDITERKRAEEAQRMATVGQLAAGVAHEFNNLLAAMMLRAEQASIRRTPHESEKLCELVLRSAGRGAEICRNLTAYASPRDPKWGSICIEAAVDNALSLVARQLEQGRVAVDRQFLTAGRQVMADQGQLEQVFLNLFVNACHAMPQGGTLTIRTHVEDTSPQGVQVVTTVTDNGIGIAQRHIGRIFEPFFTTKGRLGESDVPGTGLGLSVSLGIIRAHGGTVDVRSAVGVGTSFEIRLAAAGPGTSTAAASDAESTKPAPEAAEHGRPRQRILLAEDEDDVRDLIAEGLASAGYDLVVFDNGAAAAAAVDTGQFAAVVTDLLMAEGGGTEVLRAAQALPDPPPVIVVTGRIDDRTAAELRASGAWGIIHKPFRISHVLDAVGQAVAGSPGGDVTAG